MKHKIIGDNDCPLVEIQLAEDETVRIERGCMAYMSNVELEGRMNTSKKGIGGMFSAIGRSLTSGESFFITEATGINEQEESALPLLCRARSAVCRSMTFISTA